MPEKVKTNPLATKFQAMIRRYSAPATTTSGSFEKIRIRLPGEIWQSSVTNAINADPIRAAESIVCRTREPIRAP